MTTTTATSATVGAGAGDLLPVLLAADPTARLAFSGRAGAGPDPAGNVSLRVGAGAGSGRADALAARERLAAAVGVDPEDVVYAQQVHGPGVALVGPGDRGRGARDPADAVPGVDALVTTAPGVAVAVLTADCVPVLLVVPGRGVAAAHAGRHGVVTGVVDATVRTLTAATGSSLADVVAVVGPAVGGCCYEVPATLAREVVARVGPHVAATTTWGTPSLDLPAAVAGQLAAAGVGTVRAVGDCTRCRSDRWFSHRAAGERDRDPPVPAGRQAAVAVRGVAPPPPATPPPPAPTPSLDS